MSTANPNATALLAALRSTLPRLKRGAVAEIRAAIRGTDTHEAARDLLGVSRRHWYRLLELLPVRPPPAPRCDAEHPEYGKCVRVSGHKYEHVRGSRSWE